MSTHDRPQDPRPPLLVSGNADIVDLYTRIQVGTRVMVLPGTPPLTDARRG